MKNLFLRQLKKATLYWQLLVCLLYVVLAKTKKKKEVKSDTNFYQITKCDEQSLNQYQYIYTSSKYIHEYHIKNMFEERTIENLQQHTSVHQNKECLPFLDTKSI